MTIWIALTTGLMVLEMLTGTFYLLVLSGGAAAGALAAFFDMSLTSQIALCAAVTFTGWWVLYRRGFTLKRAPANANPDVHTDIGQIVRLVNVDSSGRHQVDYRGALWAARVEGGAAQLDIDYTIIRVEGNTLILQQP